MKNTFLCSYYKQHIFIRSLLFSQFLFLSLVLSTQSYFPNTVPNPKDVGNGYLSDPAGLIAPSTRMQINSVIADLEAKSTAQVAVVVLPSIGDAVPRQFAYELFQLWGIGQKENNNGLLLLIVMDQRRSEIETGYRREERKKLKLKKIDTVLKC